MTFWTNLRWRLHRNNYVITTSHYVIVTFCGLQRKQFWMRFILFRFHFFLPSNVPFCAILAFFIGFDFSGVNMDGFQEVFKMSRNSRWLIQKGGYTELILQFPRHVTSSLNCADHKGGTFGHTMYKLGFIVVVFMFLKLRGWGGGGGRQCAL